MILKRIFIAIYLKSVFPPYDSNIKFYNATLYSTKNVELKTSFYQKMAYAKKMRIFYKLQKKSDSKKRNNINTANLDINWIITNFLQLFTFFRVKTEFFCIIKKIQNM